ncbi:recombinase family protein [Arthrobacter sp. MDT3-44]
MSPGRLRDRGILMRFLSDGIDHAASTGRLMVHMLATFAEYETTSRLTQWVRSLRSSQLHPSSLRVAA